MVKDVLLVGFFLQIGLDHVLTIDRLEIVLLPLKAALYFCFMACFWLRAQSGTFTALTLANDSELEPSSSSPA